MFKPNPKTDLQGLLGTASRAKEIERAVADTETLQHKSVATPIFQDTSTPAVDQERRINVALRTWEFFRVLRNALAHGNIYTGFDPRQITNITFGSSVSEKPAKARGQRPTDYELITLEVANFSALLHAWLDFLSELPLTDGMQETGQAADD